MVAGASSLKVKGGKTAKASVLVRDIIDHSMESLQFHFHDVAHNLDEPQAIDVSEADRSTQITAAPQVDTTRRHGPNQKCTDDELDTLQGEADEICKGRGQNTCSESKVSKRKLAKLKCSEVLRRQAHHAACLAARREVQKICFHRTDAGHEKAMNDRIGAVALCKELAAKQCAPESPYNDQ